MSDDEMPLPSDPEERKRRVDELHFNVGLANDFRMEFVKHTMSLAGAVFIFTVTFIKDIAGPELAKVSHRELILIGWGSMLLSLVAGLGHMAGWDRFYSSYRRDFRFAIYRVGTEDRGPQTRKVVTMWRRFAMWIQLAMFAVGLLAIGLFSYANLVKGGP